MDPHTEPMKRLYRSESNRMLAGVCGGLGEFFGIDATLVRILFVVLAFASGFGIVAYVVMWLIVPTRSKAGVPPQDVPREGFEEMREGFERGTRKAKDSYERWRGGGGPPPETQPPAGQGPQTPPAGPSGPPPPPPGPPPEPPPPPRD